MKLNQDDICSLIKVVTYYRDIITGSDAIWDRYDQLLTKLKQYGEEVTEEPLVCPTDK